MWYNVCAVNIFRGKLMPKGTKMKSYKRIFTLLFFALISLSLVFVFTSCQKNDECQHEWGAWQMAHEDLSICEDDGEQFRVCKLNDEHIEYRDGEAQGHVYEGEYSSGSGGHWRFCQVCEKRKMENHVSAGAPTHESAEYCSVCNYEMSPKLHPLTNKKVIFIGNSHTYFGGVVNEKKQTVHNIANRQNDQGTFYDIATANGAVNLNVTNWTYGGHSLDDIFSGYCDANRECKAEGDTSPGYDHFSDLTDKYYDYVVIQQGSTSATDLMYWLEFIQDLFREVNPNVKFFFIVQARAHNDNYTWLTDVKTIQSELGMTVIDWGDLVHDVYRGAVAVPGAQHIHNKESYVIAKTDTDGFHPSLLGGYVASLMTYCTITGESAVGQRTDLYSDSKINSFISLNYKKKDTNLKEILKSADDMAGLQVLIDQYIEAKYYKTYTAENH